MISSHLDMINIDTELACEIGGASLEQYGENFLKVHQRLARGIQQIESGRSRSLYSDAPRHGIPLARMTPASDAAEGTVSEIGAFADEFQKRLRLEK